MKGIEEIGKNLEEEVFQTPEYVPKELSDQELINITRRGQDTQFERELSLRIRENMRRCGYNVPNSIYTPSLRFTVKNLPGSVVEKNGKKIFKGHVMQVGENGLVEINRKLRYIPESQLKKYLPKKRSHEGSHLMIKYYGIPFKRQGLDIERMIDSQVADTTENFEGIGPAMRVRKSSLYLNPNYH